MSNIYDDRPVQESLDGVWSGIIASDASSATDTVEVIIRAFSLEHRFGPARWTFNGGELPQRGNDCLVMFDDQQRPFVTWWLPDEPEWEWQSTSLVTVLPSSPTDGQEIYYQTSAMATDGVVWHFRYRAGSASARKWECVGGSPIYAELSNAEAASGTADTYQALATSGPAIPLPLAGDYDITQGFQLDTTSAVTRRAYMSYDIGATGAVDADAVITAISGAATTAIMGASSRRKIGLSAVTLTAKYKINANTSHTFSKRWMQAMPVRV